MPMIPPMSTGAPTPTAMPIVVPSDEGVVPFVALFAGEGGGMSDVGERVVGFCAIVEATSEGEEITGDRFCAIVEATSEGEEITGDNGAWEVGRLGTGGDERTEGLELEVGEDDAFVPKIT